MNSFSVYRKREKETKHCNSTAAAIITCCKLLCMEDVWEACQVDERVEPLPSCVPFHPPPLFLISSCCYSAFLAFRLFLLLDRLTTTNFLRVIKNWADIFLWAVCVITGSRHIFFIPFQTDVGWTCC